MQTIAIFGVPRSGTSWLGQVFNSHPAVAYRFQPLFSYAFKGRISTTSTKQDIDRFYKELLESNDEFILQQKNISGRKLLLQFEKNEPTHLVWKEVRYLHLLEHLIQETDTKLIALVRHPCAVLNSWHKAPKEFDVSWNLLEEWLSADKKNGGRMEEFYGYQKWKETALIFRHLQTEYPECLKTVVYEELNENPDSVVREVFDFCGLEMNEQTQDFLIRSRSISSDDPYGVFRKGHRSDQWKRDLPAAIINAIKQDAEFKELASFYGWDQAL